MRNGDFSELLTGKVLGTDAFNRPIMENAIYNPTTARVVNGQTVTDPFLGNIIPQSMFIPVAAKIQALIPAPTNGNLTLNWAQNNPNYRRQKIPAGKLDQILPDSSHLSFYFSKQDTSQLTNADGLPYPISAVRCRRSMATPLD